MFFPFKISSNDVFMSLINAINIMSYWVMYKVFSITNLSQDLIIEVKDEDLLLRSWNSLFISFIINWTFFGFGLTIISGAIYPIDSIITFYRRFRNIKQ